MAKYLLQANYTQSGVSGLLKEGGSKRRAALTETVESVGGSVESIYYAFGGTDIFLIVDVPDEASVAALSLAINAVGALTLSTTPLLDPKTIDEAIEMSVRYRPPGA